MCRQALTAKEWATKLHHTDIVTMITVTYKCMANQKAADAAEANRYIMIAIIVETQFCVVYAVLRSRSSCFR